MNRDELIGALMLAMREASGLGLLHSQAMAERLGINSTDLECLDIIIMRGPVTAGDLARATGLTTGAITGVIDRLHQAGLAERAPDPVDRRKVLARATPDVERRALPLARPMEQAALSVLSTYDDAALALVLDFLGRANKAAIAAVEALRAETVKADGGKPTRTRTSTAISRG